MSTQADLPIDALPQFVYLLMDASNVAAVLVERAAAAAAAATAAAVAEFPSLGQVGGTFAAVLTALFSHPLTGADAAVALVTRRQKAGPRGF